MLIATSSNLGDGLASPTLSIRKQTNTASSWSIEAILSFIALLIAVVSIILKLDKAIRRRQIATTSYHSNIHDTWRTDRLDSDRETELPDLAAGGPAVAAETSVFELEAESVQNLWQHHGFGRDRETPHSTSDN